MNTEASGTSTSHEAADNTTITNAEQEPTREAQDMLGLAVTTITVGSAPRAEIGEDGVVRYFHIEATESAQTPSTPAEVVPHPAPGPAQPASGLAPTLVA